MVNGLPATIELCARLRDGRPCLGRISRSGSPEIVHCTACGQRGDGIIYLLAEPSWSPPFLESVSACRHVTLTEWTAAHHRGRSLFAACPKCTGDLTTVDKE